MNDNEEIEYLINEALKNDENAFRSLIKKVEPQMYKISKIRLKDEELIYEATQNTIILIYKNLKKLKDKKLFRTWVMKILINECNKIYNKQKKYIFNNNEYKENGELLIYNQYDDVESNLNIKKLLNCLNDNEKVVMTLYYNDNFTTKEISCILREPEGTVKSQISRSKNKIKEYIKENRLYG